jgi:hypothetical protein
LDSRDVNVSALQRSTVGPLSGPELRLRVAHVSP